MVKNNDESNTVMETLLNWRGKKRISILDIMDERSASNPLAFRLARPSEGLPR